MSPPCIITGGSDQIQRLGRTPPPPPALILLSSSPTIRPLANHKRLPVASFNAEAQCELQNPVPRGGSRYANHARCGPSSCAEPLDLGQLWCRRSLRESHVASNWRRLTGIHRCERDRKGGRGGGYHHITFFFWTNFLQMDVLYVD